MPSSHTAAAELLREVSAIYVVTYEAARNAVVAQEARSAAGSSSSAPVDSDPARERGPSLSFAWGVCGDLLEYIKVLAVSHTSRRGVCVKGYVPTAFRALIGR